MQMITQSMYDKKLNSGKGTLFHLCDDVIQQVIASLISFVHYYQLVRFFTMHSRRYHTRYTSNTTSAYPLRLLYVRVVLFIRILYLNPTALQSLHRYRQCRYFRGFNSQIMRILNILFAYVKQHSQFDQDQMARISNLVNRSKIQGHIVIIPIKIKGTKLFHYNNFVILHLQEFKIPLLYKDLGTNSYSSKPKNFNIER